MNTLKINIKLLALITALILLLKNLFFDLFLGNSYFWFFIVCFIYLITYSKIKIFSKAILFLVIACGTSILFNEIPLY